MSALQGQEHTQSSTPERHGQVQGSDPAAPQHAASGTAVHATGPVEIERDADAEGELTSAARSDPFAAYDVDVALEGQAIREFMVLLADSAS